MIKVNFKDGTTLEFDLNKEADARQWLEWSCVRDFQQRITGIGILHNRKFHILTLPKGFNKVRFYAEIVSTKKHGEIRAQGERLIAHVDEIKLSLTVYTGMNPPPPVLARVDAERIGKQMFENAPLSAMGDRPSG